MLDKFLVLLERFVVAHELIAANSHKLTSTQIQQHIAMQELTDLSQDMAKEVPVEGEDVIDTQPAKAKPEPEDDLDDEEPEEKPKQKRTRQAKTKDEPKGPDVAKLREEIKTIAKAIAAGDSDECADKFDELLEDYKVRTVTKLADEDVEVFHKDATKLVGKYYEVEE
jgi:outer membrane biosynthesis protein TonB